MSNFETRHMNDNDVVRSAIQIALAILLALLFLIVIAVLILFPIAFGAGFGSTPGHYVTPFGWVLLVLADLSLVIGVIWFTVPRLLRLGHTS